jgi:hypothetical protein
MNLEYCSDRCTEVVGFGLWCVMDIDWKAASGDIENRGCIKVFLDIVRQGLIEQRTEDLPKMLAHSMWRN